MKPILPEGALDRAEQERRTGAQPTPEQIMKWFNGCDQPVYWWAPNRQQSKELCQMALALAQKDAELAAVRAAAQMNFLTTEVKLIAAEQRLATTSTQIDSLQTGLREQLEGNRVLNERLATVEAVAYPGLTDAIKKWAGNSYVSLRPNGNWTISPAFESFRPSGVMFSQEDAIKLLAATRSLAPEANGEPVVQDIHQWKSDLLSATSIGMATIIVRCGAYESLSPYLKGQYDELARLHAKCDRAFNASPQPGAGKDKEDAKRPYGWLMMDADERMYAVFEDPHDPDAKPFWLQHQSIDSARGAGKERTR